MDLVNLCLSPLCSCLQSPLMRQDMGNVFHTKDRLNDLKKAMERLMATKRDIERELHDPQHKGKLQGDELQLWLRDVGEKDDKVERLLDEYGKGNCVAGSCSLDCFSRYKISMNAMKLKEEITELTAKQPKIGLIDIPPPEPVPESYKIVGKKISSNLNVACSYLADERVGMIGIWGMGGVGKTTLLKKINQSVLDDDANTGFDHVLFIEASQNMQLEKLREEIAKELKLAPSASKKDIFDVLKTKNFVLFLDNIWKEIDFVNLGIPHPKAGNTGTAHYKRKVIFTTRSEDVCAQMGAGEKIIKVECLEPYESWDLFKDNVNHDIIESDVKFKKVAGEVMEKCGGLPLALKVVGKAMSNKKTVQDWEFILNSLKNSGTEIVQGVQESLLSVLKFSYDTLPNNMNIKECFLWASILQRPSKDNLFECWMGLGLINDFVNLQEAYGKASYIFNILKDSCLLYFSDDDRVYLHDVIYEMAMWIVSDCGRNRNKWIVKRYDKLTKITATDAENWRFANRVIIRGLVEMLPILHHECPDLLCLIIQKSKLCLQNIGEGFFRQTANLAYLNLSNTYIEQLPKDIECLVNLQYLNISYTRISSLPKELVNLNKLQYLICSYLEGLSKVEEGLMPRLHKLKIIDLYPYGWLELEELKILKKHIKGIGMRVVSEEVLQQLSCLPTTQLYIENLDNLTSLSFDTLSCKDHGFLQELEIISCPNLKELVMNGRETRVNHLKISHMEQLQHIIWPGLSPPKFFPMLKKLFIKNCKLASLAWVLHLPCLTFLYIKSCAEIETLFYVEEGREIQQQVSERPTTFPALQFLHISKLPKLVSISKFALDFPRLSHLSISEYKLASFAWVLHLPCLVYLDIKKCPEAETLFHVEEEERKIQQVSERTTFPVLRSLRLRNLPKLVSMSNFALDFPRFSWLTVEECHNLKKLPFKHGTNNNQRTIFIECEGQWWENLEWDDATIPSHLRPFHP